jgi:hypothetical protein
MSTNLSPNGQSAHVADEREIGVPLRHGGDEPKPPRKSTDVDLAAWGRGEKEYLFDEWSRLSMTMCWP